MRDCPSVATEELQGGFRLVELTVLKDGVRRRIYFADPQLGG